MMFLRSKTRVEDIFDRQMRIQGLSQYRILNSTIGIIGAGATGSHCALQAAKVGIGTIKICDYDRVELHNIPRLLGITPNDVGRNKARALAEAIRRSGSMSKVQAYPVPFNELPEEFYSKTNVIILCVDTISTRFEIGEALWNRGIPHVDIGIRELLLNIMVVLPTMKAPCLYCARKIIPTAQLQHSNTAQHCQDNPIPTIITTASIASSLAITEVLKIITNFELGQPIEGFLQIDTRNQIYLKIAMEKDGRCPVCNSIDARDSNEINNKIASGDKIERG